MEDNDAGAGSGDANHLLDGPPLVPELGDAAVVENGVEGLIGEGQMRGLTLHEVGLESAAAQLPAAAGEHGGGDVHADEAAPGSDLLLQQRQVSPGPNTNFEHPTARLEVQATHGFPPLIRGRLAAEERGYAVCPVIPASASFVVVARAALTFVHRPAITALPLRQA